MATKKQWKRVTHSNSNPRSGRFLFVCSTPDWCCRIGPVAFALWRVGVLQHFGGLFPATVYHLVGSSVVLPDLLQAMNKDLLTTAQFLRNGALHLTFKPCTECEGVLASRIRYGDVQIRLAPAGAQLRIIYLRDCPSEVSNVVIRFFFTFVGDGSIVHAPGLPRVAWWQSYCLHLGVQRHP